MHDDEAKRCIMTTIRTEGFEKLPDVEEITKAILEALAREGLYVVRNGGQQGT